MRVSAGQRGPGPGARAKERRSFGKFGSVPRGWMSCSHNSSRKLAIAKLAVKNSQFFERFESFGQMIRVIH